MKWTEPKKATEGVSFYDHIIAETPIGRMTIEWKSWKENDDYSVMLDDEWIGAGISLKEAKQIGEDYLNNKLKKLTEYMQDVS